MAGSHGKRPTSPRTSGAPATSIDLDAAGDDTVEIRPRRVLYGRRKGRKLHRGRADLLQTLLPTINVPSGEAELDPTALFTPRPTAIWLEVGFGGGEHLAWHAVRNPEIGLIGCEPFINGIAKLLAELRDHALRNVRIHTDDAGLLLARLAPASLARVFVLFPDPWPKTRHHKRRFISAANLAQIARALRAGGELRVASDDMSYIAWTLEHVRRSGAFDWTARCPQDWRARPDDWPETRYEAKAKRSGRRPVFLRFVRRP